MLEWFKVNWLTVAIVAVLAAAVLAIVLSLIRDRKKGCFSCGGGCAHCPMAVKCHQQTATDRK